MHEVGHAIGFDDLDGANPPNYMSSGPAVQAHQAHLRAQRAVSSDMRRLGFMTWAPGRRIIGEFLGK